MNYPFVFILNKSLVFFNLLMLLVMSALGAAAALMGTLFGQVGTYWYFIVAVILMVMGLQLAGIIKLNLGGNSQKFLPQKTGLIGALILGMLFGLVLSPCASPVLAVILTLAAVQGKVAYGSSLLFAYALGDGTDFDTIYFRNTLPAGTFAIVEGAWLLRPTLAEQLTQEEEPEAEPQPEPSPEPGADVEVGKPPVITPQPQPAPQAQTYRRVTIQTPVDWRQWYDFYQAIIRPLVEAGVEVKLELSVEASGEIDANLVDLSVKESVLQFNPQGNVTVEE